MNIDHVAQIRLLEGEMKRHVDFEILTPEAKILFTVMQHNGASIKDIMLYSGLGYGSFYHGIGKLVNNGKIMVNKDVNDGRVRKVYICNK